MPPRRDAKRRIDHMLEAIEGIQRIVSAHGLDALQGDWMRRSALERGFEVISEASRHLPDHLKATEPDIPWKDIAGIGNILRHDYDGVQLSMVIETATSDLPVLKEALERMRRKQSGQNGGAH